MCTHTHTQTHTYCSCSICYVSYSNTAHNIENTGTAREHCSPLLQWKSNVFHILRVCLWPEASMKKCACAVLYCNLCPIRIYHIFFTLSHKRHDFRKKKNILMCVLILLVPTNLSEIILIIRRIQRDFIVDVRTSSCKVPVNPLKPELNQICYLLALLGAHHFLHVSRIRVKLLTFRLLMSYIYIWSTHS